ncbi:fasciclin domain-containing protein [Niabella terrae]
MNFSIYRLLRWGAGLLILCWLLIACNKELPQPVPLTPAPTEGTETILEKLNADEFSILKAAVEKASGFASSTGKLSDILGNPEGEITFFAPDNTAILTSFALLGLPADPSTLNLFSAGRLDTLLKYHIIGGQTLTSAKITETFPNLYLQSSLVLAPPSAELPPGLRMPIFLDREGSFSFVNNVPVTGPDMMASNGVMHKTAIALLPPEMVLWQRIATDNSYSYFRAAVLKADEGDEAKTLQNALSNPAANLTVFAPTNAAFQALLTAQIAQGVRPLVQQQYMATYLVPAIKAANPGISDEDALTQATALAATEPHATNITNGAIEQAGLLASTPDVFSNPMLASVLTPTVVKGLVVYHILGKKAYTVNIPAAGVSTPTLLNTGAGYETHPGLALKAVFGATGVTAATVKGVGNATAANIQISAPPSTTQDVNHINGVIHRIDQVLLPQ